MSMRSQIYAWNSQSTAGGTTAWTNANTGNSVSIFIGGFGNNITKPAETTATQFVVIEDVAVSPTAFGVSTQSNTYYRGLESNGSCNGVYGNRAYIQIRINTTEITSLTLTMLETMVSRVRQVLTQEAQTSNHVSTFTPMSMCYRDKCLTHWLLATKTAFSLLRLPLKATNCRHL